MNLSNFLVRLFIQTHAIVKHTCVTRDFLLGMSVLELRSQGDEYMFLGGATLTDCKIVAVPKNTLENLFIFKPVFYNKP